MTVAAGIGGPVSAALESDVRTWVRRHGIVVWLDLDDHYTAFVDRLVKAREEGELPYEVRALRGSHLALMMELQGVTAGSERGHLLIHLPGFSVESVRRTPLYELYAAGVRYWKALPTLITEAADGRVPPDRIGAFTGEAHLTLDDADVWLEGILTDGDDGFSGQLRAMGPTALLDDLLRGGFVASRVGRPREQEAIWERLAAWTGLPQRWREAALPGPAVGAEDVASAMAGWALGVEYVDDLERKPVSPILATAVGLPRGVVETCLGIASHLREHHRAAYRRIADETEALLADEMSSVQASDLGRVDTFRVEDEKVLKAALQALADGNWEAAGGWAGERLAVEGEDGSFWLREEPLRQSAWELVHGAARLGDAIAQAGGRIAAHGGLEGATEAYIDRGAPVDQAHRHLEQRRAALLYPQLPEFESLRARLDDMRRLWRSWADQWARDFNALCKEHGFLPPSSHQQRALFDEVVRPLAREPGTTALFLIDAFRYEMGAELYRELVDTPAATVHLKARLAELPTVTSVGMNVLAPVAANGRLAPVMASNGSGVTGFSTGEFRVSDPDTRKRAMHDRVGGTTCPWLTLEEVVSRDAASLKRAVAQARLVVVHSQEIDHAGEKGVGPAVFDQVMQRLRAAWRLLRDAGVRRFVLTSDHGFLLLDDAAASAQTHGRKVDPKRRHVFSQVPADHTGEVRVPLADLGYEGVEGYLMFPETTAVFDTGRRALTFVHGGNSLQERIIPVLTVVHRAAAGGSPMQYGLKAEAREGVAGMHCLEVRVEVVGQRSLDFGSAKVVDLTLRVSEAEDVEVELCQVRGGARIAGGLVRATVGEPFELFFRLLGSLDARVLVELHHPSAVAEVAPYVPATRFAVMATRPPPTPESLPAPAVQSAEPGWLELLPEGGPRHVFRHLLVHGTVTEAEATTMLGGARGLRRFALQFDELARRAPFAVRIDVVSGVKRYVREGSA